MHDRRKPFKTQVECPEALSNCVGAMKMISVLMLFMSLVATAVAGPMVCAGCYTACIAGCWANGVAATAATLGVAAPAGLWGAAACSSMCAPLCACTCAAPTP